MPEWRECTALKRPNLSRQAYTAVSCIAPLGTFSMKVMDSVPRNATRSVAPALDAASGGDDGLFTRW